jgi:hypothetical protein
MKIGYVGLFALFLILTLMVPAAQAQAQTDNDSLRWVTVGTPGEANNIVVTPSEVSEIAVASDGTLYALDSSNNGTNKVYKSINDGASWVDITPQLLTAGATMPATKIAIAPDDPNTLALVTDNGSAVYLSKSAGGVWINMHAPVTTTKIRAIAISRQYTESYEAIREVAIGTADWGNATTEGQIFVCQIGVDWPTWQNQNLTVDGTNFVGDVSAIAYSPNFGRNTDKTIVVVASTGGDVNITCQNQTRLCLGKRDTTTETTLWNAPTFTDYPVKIGSAAGDGTDVGVTGILSSLALPSNFSPTTIQLFVSVNRKTGDTTNDVYRINDDATTTRLNVNGGSPIDISSISYQGTTASGKLLAGGADQIGTTFTVQVWRTSNPWDTMVPVSWNPASLPPSGPGNAKVVWGSGSTVYCGTGQKPSVPLDESAFSVSYDGGDNWQQQSLMDTILHMSDIAPTPNSQTLFLASYSDTNPEGIWRSTVTTQGLGVYWSRQLMVATDNSRLLIRLSPNYLTDYTIYVIEVGGTVLYVSHDRGNSWKLLTCLGDAIDGIAVNRDTFYVALPGGYIRWTNDGGFIWSDLVYTGITDINTFTVTTNGSIIIGGRNGEVAYSTNGGASFTQTYHNLAAGDIQVAADADFTQSGIIYAASNVSDSGIWRWQIGISIVWEQIDKVITNLGGGQRIDGLLTSAEGVLYALRAEQNGGVSRSLNPAALGYPDTPEFSVANLGLPLPPDTAAAFDSTMVFSHTLPFLKFSIDEGQNELWSIDTVNEKIYRFMDILASIPPTITAPQDLHLTNINSINGKGYDVLLCWSRPSPNVTGYEVGVYSDAACTRLIQSCNVASTSETPCVEMGPNQPGNRYVGFTPGSMYYWRVRVITPFMSLWSMIISNDIQPIALSVPDILTPENGAKDINQTPFLSWSSVAEAGTYRLLLADNAEFDSPIVDIEVEDTGFLVTSQLDYGKTYYWEVRLISPSGSEWSTIANFTVIGAPTESAPPVVITQGTPSVSTITQSLSPLYIEITVPSFTPNTDVPVNVWIAIGVGSILVIFIIILIITTTPPNKANKKPT